MIADLNEVARYCNEAGSEGVPEHTSQCVEEYAERLTVC